MQTDILLKQVTSSLAELKAAIEKFEKHPSPSTQYAEQLHASMNEAHKLVSAYVVLKEQKDVSPELDLHLKIMNVQEVAPVKDTTKEVVKPVEVIAGPVVEKPLAVVPEPIIEKPVEVKPAEPIVETPVVPQQKPVIPVIQETPVEKIIPQQTEPVSKPIVNKELPKLSVSINDKFRLINELFASNANEYAIAVEQLNSLNTLDETRAYLKGLKSIYNWDDDNEMVKKIGSLIQKRFA